MNEVFKEIEGSSEDIINVIQHELDVPKPEYAKRKLLDYPESFATES